MGTLYKRPDRGGKSGNWYAQYIDGNNKRTAHRSTGTSDKATAKRILASWEAEAALRRKGVIDPTLERISDQSKRPLSEHIAEFQAAIESPGNSEKHVAETMKIIRDVVAREGWTVFSDVTIESAENYSAHLRKDLKRSNRTIQKHLAALKQFTNWAHEKKRLSHDPLAGLRTPNPQVDRRLERRALHPEEWPLLRDATMRAADTESGLSGPDRALLYELTLQTGLRQNEVRELTAGKLHLDQSPPFVLLPSRSTKNKKPARQYVTAQLATRLKAYAAQQLPGTPLFDLPHESTVAKMIRRDLAAARDAWLKEAETMQGQAKAKKERAKREKSDFLAPVDHEGRRFDFHALRHTCGAWLAMAGKNPKTIQTIMRHSTITLTMDTYGHLFPAAESDAIADMGVRHFDVAAG